MPFRIPHSALRIRVGLTLVEVLVAMMILVTISASSALIFRGISQSWRKGQLKTERYQQARLLFDLFEQEISSCVANVRFPFMGLQAGDASPLHEGPALSDELMCVATLPGRSGLVERGYWVDDAAHLMCHDEEPADGDYTTGESELCGTDVVGFELTYRHPDDPSAEELQRWDGRAAGAQEGRLPKAVRVLLRVGQQQPEQFETVIYVPTS